MEKRESPYIVGGNVNWYNHYGKQYGGSLKTKYRTTTWVGGGIRMGNTCKSMADSCQCMAKNTKIL